MNNCFTVKLSIFFPLSNGVTYTDQKENKGLAIVWVSFVFLGQQGFFLTVKLLLSKLSLHQNFSEDSLPGQFQHSGLVRVHPRITCGQWQ